MEKICHNGLGETGTARQIQRITLSPRARGPGNTSLAPGCNFFPPPVYLNRMVDLHDLYSRYAADVRRFALYLTGDAALADDITSEAPTGMELGRADSRGDCQGLPLYDRAQSVSAGNPPIIAPHWSCRTRFRHGAPSRNGTSITRQPSRPCSAPCAHVAGRSGGVC